MKRKKKISQKKKFNRWYKKNKPNFETEHISTLMGVEFFYLRLNQSFMHYKNIWYKDYVIWKLSKGGIKNG